MKSSLFPSQRVLHCGAVSRFWGAGLMVLCLVFVLVFEVVEKGCGCLWVNLFFIWYVCWVWRVA